MKKNALGIKVRFVFMMWVEGELMLNLKLSEVFALGKG